jgi:hypothetical protein
MSTVVLVHDAAAAEDAGEEGRDELGGMEGD